MPKPAPSTRSNGPSMELRDFFPIERASSFMKRKLGRNRRTKASTAPAVAVPTAPVSASETGEWNSRSATIADEPGEQRQDFVHEPADEADHGSPAQQDDDEDVERAHGTRLANSSRSEKCPLST